MRRCVLPFATLLLLVAAWHSVAAQVAKGSPPPTYGQTIFSRYEGRFVRQGQLNVTFIVPSASLQALLAPGYSVPPGNTASIIAAFNLQQREELPNAIGNLAKGTYGPASSMIVYADALNPSGHYEQFELDNERSTEDSVLLVNALWGEGSSRKPSSLRIDLNEVTPEAEDKDAARDGTKETPFIRFSGHAENEASGLVLGVRAVVPADITTPMRNSLNRGPDGQPEPFRFVNDSVRPPVPNAAIIQVINDDRITVPSEGHLRVEIRERELHLPGGTLPILGVGPTVTLIRNRENFQMRCTPSFCP